MKFGPVSLEQAEGKILAHNVAGQDGRRAFRKGSPAGAWGWRRAANLATKTVIVDCDQARVSPMEIAEAIDAGAAEFVARWEPGKGKKASSMLVRT